jgi:cyclic beta-1,2-glucan synthetase
MLNPVYHADTPEKIGIYHVEPYIVAADIYSVDPYLGHGGWTWYTGSASWMYRVGLESILGLHRQGGKLSIKPCIPPDWPGYSIAYRFGDTVYHIHVENPVGAYHAVSQVILDSQLLSGYEISLQNDGKEHEVSIVMK